MLRLVAMLLAVAVAAAACGDDDDDATSGGEDGGEDATAALGEPNAASGEPILVGTITELGSEAIGAQSQQTLDGMNMAVEYVNEYRGGIAGRPIELFHCGNQATPAGAQDCANQMVEKGVVAVILPFTAQSAAQVPIITGAGIPYMIGSGTTQEDFTTPGAFSVGGGYVATLGAVAQHASDQGIEKLTHIVIDVPTAVSAAEQIGGLVFGNAGVDYETVSVAPGTPDMTPQLQAAASGGADALMVTGDQTFCTSFLKGYQTLALDQQLYVIATCVDPTVIDAVPGVFDGAFLTTNVDPDSDDVALYGDMLAAYMSDDDVDPNPMISSGTAGGVATVMTFWAFMDGFTGDVTKDTVMEQVKTATDVPAFMSGGSTLTCDGTAIPLLPNVCGADVQMATLDANALPTEFEPIDAAPLFSTS